MTTNINYRQKANKSLSILVRLRTHACAISVTEILRVKLIKQMDAIIFLRSNRTFNITRNKESRSREFASLSVLLALREPLLLSFLLGRDAKGNRFVEKQSHREW